MASVDLAEALVADPATRPDGFVVEGYSAGGHNAPPPIGQIVDGVAPAPGEPVIVKRYPSSFVQTDLDERLRGGTSKDLVLAGFMTHMCVNSTARDALNLGYRPTVVASATATRELPEPDGVSVGAASLQAASLATITDLFGIVFAKPDDIPD